MSRFLNLLRRKNIVKLKIEGPLNQTFQTQMMQRLVEIQKMRSNALLVVINSYGGPLQVAKNIAAKLKHIAFKNQYVFDNSFRIPVYCFAEQLCLNSANVILTCGAKSFANKFSMIGDFGYSHTTLDFQQFSKRYNIKQSTISSNTTTQQQPLKRDIFNLTGSMMLNDPKLIEKHLKQAQQDLRSQILKNRKNKLLPKNQKIEQQFKQHILNGGIMDPIDAIKYGYIDELMNIQAFIVLYYSGSKVISGNGKQFKYSSFQRLYDITQAIKKRDLK